MESISKRSLIRLIPWEFFIQKSQRRPWQSESLFNYCSDLCSKCLADQHSVQLVAQEAQAFFSWSNLVTWDTDCHEKRTEYKKGLTLTLPIRPSVTPLCLYTKHTLTLNTVFNNANLNLYSRELSETKPRDKLIKEIHYSRLYNSSS